MIADKPQAGRDRCRGEGLPKRQSQSLLPFPFFLFLSALGTTSGRIWREMCNSWSRWYVQTKTSVKSLNFVDTPQGATPAQARAALRQYKDVMEAAEKFFQGDFDNVKDEDGDISMASSSRRSELKRPARPAVSVACRTSFL